MAKRKAKKKSSRKAAANRDLLCVGSKVKNYVCENGMMASGDLIESLSERVYALLDNAIARCNANKRSTVRPHDI